ncbi:MAG: serine/threonine protein kinase [Prevotellaceae bacterium]|nr:serine/threonine protein kinase [Candidatus Minthosoma caballi]
MQNIQALGKGFKLHGDKEYVIQDVLGHGGCGILYRATSIVMDGNIKQTHEYAIKEYFDKDCCRRLADGSVELTDASEEYKGDEFRAEAICLKDLKWHKNIVQVNEVFEQNGTFYYVMEYLDGTSLHSFVKEAMPEKEAITYIKDIALALDYLHSEKINHLDVKPDNIMVVKDPDSNRHRLVLIDFGLSKHFDKSGKKKKHQGYDGASSGYSPKEQYEGIEVFSPEADVYALAATLFFLLTASDPCNGKDMTSRYLHGNLPENISDRTFDALAGALNSDCKKRTSTVAAFFEELTGSPLTNSSASRGSEKKGRVTTERFETKKLKKKVSGISAFGDNNGKIIKICGIAAAVAIIAGLLIFVPKSCGNSKDKTQDDSTKVEEAVTAGTATTEGTETEEGGLESPTNDDEVSQVSDNNNSQPQSTNTDTSKPSKEESTPANKVETTQSVNKPAPQPEPKKIISSGTLDLGYATWTGGIKNGKPDGYGKMTFRQSHRLNSECTANAGDVFDGDYTSGKMDNGKLRRSNGEIETILGGD